MTQPKLGKTIQVYLPDGDPRGIRVAEITTRIVQVIEVPRPLLDAFLAMPESSQVAVYFLFGGTESDDGAQVYVGQSGDLKTRLAEHNKKKDFWQRACVVLSKTNSLTQTHALFLEWYCLQMADRVDRYTITNGHLGSKPYTPTPLQSDCLEIFEAAQVLLATLGFPIFEPLTPEPGQATKSEEYVCKAGGCDARGLYTPEGFVVLKGSVGRKGNVPSLAGTSDERFRAKLVESGVMREDGDRVVFEKDHLFGSPSMAAIAVLGRTANGWLEWKTSDGRTLDAVERSGA